MASSASSAPPGEPPARFDAAAARRALARLARAGEAPWLHQEIARRMGQRLSLILAQPASVLDWSGPAGGSAAVLSSTYPRSRCEWVDEGHVPAPAATPPTWWQRWRRVPMPAAVAAQAVPPRSAGLVWSNMRLHFEPDPLPLLRAWRAALAPEGFLMFSTLGPGSLALLREVHAQAGWGPAHAPFVDMHDLGDMLVETGFADPVMDQETITLTYASAASLLAEMRGLGANMAWGRIAGLRTPRWRAGLVREIERRAGEGGRMALQFEVVYGHAFRAADTGPRVEAQTQIGLEEMKLMLRKPGSRK